MIVNNAKYKLSFFNVIENRDKVKYFYNYKDFSNLYYMLLGATYIKDLKAFKYNVAAKKYFGVINV